MTQAEVVHTIDYECVTTTSKETECFVDVLQNITHLCIWNTDEITHNELLEYTFYMRTHEGISNNGRSDIVSEYVGLKCYFGSTKYTTQFLFIISLSFTDTLKTICN